jgi:hypothetical protein
LGAALQSFSRYLELAGEEADPYVVKQVRELEAPQVSPVILLTLIAAALLFRAARR